MLHYNIYLKNYWETQEDEFSFVDYKSHFSTEEPCNIYLVGIRPRVIIDPNYLIINNEEIELKFKVQIQTEFKEILGTIKLDRNINGELIIESEFPHSKFNLKDDNGYFFSKQNSEYIDNNEIGIKAFYALRASKHETVINYNDLELLYIGKSLKMDKKISPVKRISNHQKIKGILLRCTQKYIDKEVYILLCSYVKKISLVSLGDKLSIYQGKKNEFISDLNNMVSTLNANTEFTTQIAEAALIDYFDTKEFNVDFIGSFGRKTHSYYNQIIKSKISTIVVETDFQNLCKVYTKTIESKEKHFVKYFPKENFLKTVEFLDDEFNRY